MKLIIDDSKCTEFNITQEEALIVFSAMNKELNHAVKSLMDKGILDFKDKVFTLTEKGSNKIKEICKLVSDIDDEDRLNSLAQSMKECFPVGKMPGTAYYYRCNNREIISKMRKFFNIYGNYSDDEIIDATRRFVASYNGNTRFLPLIKYFILKNKTVEDEDGTRHIVEVSELASYLENSNIEEIEPDDDDWLTSSRN